MNARFYISILICSFPLAALAGSPTSGEGLSELLTRMDVAAASFTGMTAILKRVDHTDILGSNEQEIAQVKLKRSKTGLVGRVEFPDPNRRTVSLHDRTVEVFYPKSNTVQIVDAREFGQQFDQFLLLGFGTSGKDLEKNYHVRLIGTVMLGDRKTTHIELTPKSKQMLEYFQKAELWMAGGAPYPIQEKVHINEQDYKLINYTDVKLNVVLTDKELELKLPSGVTKIYPQK